MKQHPLVTILILNWNRKNEVLAAINSAKRQTYPNIEVLVIDNASTDGSVEAVNKMYQDIDLFVLDDNYGCVGGRNRGLKHVNGEYVFFMDDDALLHERAVEIAYEMMQTDSRIGVVGGVVNLVDKLDNSMISSSIDKKDKGKLAINFHGGVCMHRVSMYEHTGTYPDHYYYGGEEGYLALKMLNNGYYIISNSNVVLWHLKMAENRNFAKELAYRQINGLSNRLTFWPPEFVFVYVLKSFIRHPYQAIIRGMFKDWLSIYTKTLSSRLKVVFRERNPLRRDSLKKFYTLKKFNVHKVEEVQNSKISYVTSLFHEITRS